MSWKFVLSLIFALVVAVFALQNAAAVDVNFLVWKVSVSQALIVLASAVFGALAVLLLSLVKQMKLNSVIRHDRKTIAALQNENEAMKTKVNQAAAEAAEVTEVAAPVQEQMEQ